MTQTGIPFLFMRGVTSRGPYFNRADLPEDRDLLAQVLIAAVGSGHPLNIDGIGGGNAVTTKVAMLSASNDDWADIDYFFAQVSVEDAKVDFKPTCGNMLSSVGQAALEMGLMKAGDPVTEVPAHRQARAAMGATIFDAVNHAVLVAPDNDLFAQPRQPLRQQGRRNRAGRQRAQCAAPRQINHARPLAQTGRLADPPARAAQRRPGRSRRLHHRIW